MSLVLAAAGSDTQAHDALEALCCAYWFPLYAYLRRQGQSAEDAQDLTQGFLARLLEKQALRRFRQERGRFRSFLLSSLKHFVANERDAAQAQKRGGGAPVMSWEELAGNGEQLYQTAGRSELTPEKIFDKQWALALLQQVMERLRDEYQRSGRGEQFLRLQSYLTGNDSGVAYRQLAGELNLSESAVKVAVHRLRRRFREVLREEIGATVAHADEISDEIRYLMAVLRA